jgi:hypothetical protein
MKSIVVHFSAFIMVAMLVFAAPAQAQKPTKGDATAPTREQVIAQWKNGDQVFNFNQDGTCIITIGKVRQCPAKWTLSGNTITVNPKRLMWKKSDPCSLTHTITLISVKTDKMLIEVDGRKKIHLKKANDLL